MCSSVYIYIMYNLYIYIYIILFIDICKEEKERKLVCSCSTQVFVFFSNTLHTAIILRNIKKKWNLTSLKVGGGTCDYEVEGPGSHTWETQ